MTTTTESLSSPWWYQQRGIVLGLIYFIGFFFGSLFWALRGAPYVPFYLWAGAMLGPHGPMILLWVATLFVIACWVVRAWGSSYLSAAVVWNPDARTDALLVDGPFRYVRNPLYLGNLFMAIGIGALAPPCGFGLVLLGNAFFLHVLAEYESRGLRAQYGDIYNAYARAVPALVPRLSPARIESSVPGTPSLRQGLRAEIFSAAMVIGMLYILADGRYRLPVFTFLYAAGWTLQRLANRRFSQVRNL
jgi:protein-S-isoprenylcysteine O-methyltransferase Ste14